MKGFFTKKKGILGRALAVVLVAVLMITVIPTSANEPETPCEHGLTEEVREGDYIIQRCFYCHEEFSRTFDGHVHSWNEGEVLVPADCEDEGIMKFTCTTCEAVKSEPIPRTAHEFAYDRTVEPTCTEDGYDVYKCANCDATENRNTVSALGHDFQEETIHDETLGDITLTLCSRCSLPQENASEHTHSYTSEVTTPATCTEAGVKTYTCECGDTYTEAIDALGHDFEWSVTTPATCTEAGVKTQVCTRCQGTGETEAIPAAGHDWDYYGLADIIVEPTCEAPGVQAIHCRNCEQTMTTEFPQLDHEYELTSTVPSTCAVAGYKEYTCSICNGTRREALPLVDHTYVDDTIVTPATCTTDGVKASVCSVCGDRQNEEAIPATGHSFETIETTPATCENESTEKLQCSVCQAIQYTHNTPATGHNYGEWTVDREPTCTVAGSKSRVCQNDASHVETEEIPVIEHDYRWVRTVEPTYTAEGEEAYKCSMCGDVSETRAVDRLDHEHNFINETIVTPPTCQTPGVGSHRCTICEQTIEYEIPIVDHAYADRPTVDFPSTCITEGQQSVKCSWCLLKKADTIERLPLAEHTYSDEYTVDVAPTCTAVGSKSRHCTTEGCTAKIDETEMAMVDHTLEVLEVVEPTCTEAGYTTFKCANCDYTENGADVPALGHNYASEVTAPTCTEAGFTTYTCTRCGNSYTDDPVDALGHTPAEAVRERVVPATCTTVGSYDEVIYCSVCNAEISREAKELAIDPDNHVLVENTVNEVEPTCTEAGSRIDTCSLCNEQVTVEVPALGHDYVAEVTKQPTYDEAGVKTFTCSRCNDTYTEAIAKLVRPATPSPAPIAEPAVVPAEPVVEEPARVVEQPKTEVPGMSAQVDADVLDKVTAVKDETVEFNIEDVVLTDEVLQAARENGNTIVLKANGYKWSIDASTVGTVADDVKLDVVVGDTNIATEELEEFVADSEYMTLSLVYEGTFGFEAVLELDVDEAQAGKMATLYYYHDGIFEKMGDSLVENGAVKFDFSHASEYVVVFAEATATVVDTVEPVVEPTETVAPVVSDNKSEVSTVSSTIEPMVIEEKKTSPMIWVLIGLAVIALGGAIAYAVVSKKSE